MREDPKAAHLLYVGTDAGVFVSLDKGAKWTALTGGLPHVPVHDVAVHPREGDLVLATHGRSVYVAEAAPLRKLTAEVRAKALHAFPVKTVKAGANRGTATIRGSRGRGRTCWPASPTGPRAARRSRSAIKDEHGSVWRELAGHLARGHERGRLRPLRGPEAGRRRGGGRAWPRRGRRRPRARRTHRGRRRDEKRSDAAGDDEEDEEDADDATLEETSSSSGKPMLDPALERLLADPLRSSRRRYLPPGRYTVEVRSGAAMSTSRLTIKAPKEDGAR